MNDFVQKNDIYMRMHNFLPGIKGNRRILLFCDLTKETTKETNRLGLV